MSWFTGSQSGNETAEIDSLIRTLENPSNVPTAILSLLEMSSNPQNAAHMCQNGLPAIFTALIHSKMNDEVVSDIFSLINNLISNHENAILVMDYDLALPILIDCVDSPNPKKRLAVIKIITKLSVMDPTLIQKNLMNDQDRLVHFLKLIDDDNETVLVEFMDLIPILIVGSTYFQQLFAFYILSTLVKLAQQRQTSSMAALRAILARNVNTQSLFFESGNIESLVPLLESEDQETLAMFLDLFSEESSSKFRESLLGSKLFDVTCQKAISGNDQFVRLLGLCVRGNQDLCNALRDNLVALVTCYVKSSDELYDLYFMSFFKNYLYKLPSNSVNLANAIVSIDDRTDKKLIALASECLMASDECKSSFIGSAFVISMIGFFISNMFLDVVVPFLICFCQNSRSACLDVINESSQPVTFMMEMMSRDLDRLIHAQLCLLMKILIPHVSDVPEGGLISDEQLNEVIRDFLTYISTVAKNPTLAFQQKIIEELLDGRPLEEKKPITVEEIEEEDLPEPIIVNEAEKPDVRDNQDLTSIVESYERTFEQMKQEQWEERLRYEEKIRELSERVPAVVESSDNELVEHLTKQLESMKSANAALREQFDEYRRNGNKEIDDLVAKHNNELNRERQDSQREELMLRSRIDELQTRLDNQSVTHQKEISELRQQFYSKEGEYQTEINRLKNLLSVKTSEAVTLLRNDCKAVKNELDIFKAQERSMFTEHLNELRDRKRETDKIISENCHLKYRISQLTKENGASFDEIKALKKQIEEHSRVDAEYQIYKAELSEAQGKILDLVKENAVLKTKDGSESGWESLYEKVKSENDELKNELRTTRIDFESIRADLAAKETHLRNAETELAEKRNIISRKEDNRELEQLQEQIRQLKTQNNDLRIEKQRIQDNASEELHEAHLKHESSVQELRKFTESWEEKETEIADLVKFNNELSEKTRKMQKQIELSEDECRRLATTISSKDKQIERLQNELSRTREVNDQLRSLPPPKSDSTTSDMIPMLTDNYNKLQQQLVKSSDQVSALMRENQITKDEIKRNQEQNASLTRENLTLKDELKRYREQVDRLAIDKEDLTRRLDNVSDRERTAAKMKRDSAELASKVSRQIENSMSTLQDKVANLMSQCESLQKLRVERDTLRQQNSSQLIEFEKVKQDSDKAISDLKSKVEILQQKAKYAPIAKDLKMKLTEVTRQKDDLSARLHLIEESNEKLSRANAALTAKIRELVDDFAEQATSECSECEILRMKNCKLQTEFQKLRAQAASLSDQNKGLLAKIADLNVCLTKSNLDSELISVEMQLKTSGKQRLRSSQLPETITFSKDERSESNNEKQMRAMRIIGKLRTDRAINK